MDAGNTTPMKARRHWYQFSLRSMLLATAVFALVLGLTIHYRMHLWWRYSAAGTRLTDVEAIPTGPMPDAPSPKAWSHCRFGSLEFVLPLKLTKNLEAAPGLLCLHDDSRSVIIRLPTDLTDELAFLQTDLAMPPQAQGLSCPRLRVACYQSSFDGFRWSMTQEEVRWHVWRVAMSPMLRLRSDGWVETLFRNDLEGVAHFGGEHAAFDWQTKHGKVGAYIHFKQQDGEIDPTWVRSVCQSLRFSGEAFPQRVPKKKVLALFQVVSE